MISSFKGISFKKVNGIKEVIIVIKQRILKRLKSSEVTPINKSFILEPTKGANTPFEKFNVPVKNAKQVASILLGVILAKRTIVGNYVYAKPSVPRTTSVNVINIMSLMPINKFSRSTNIKLKILPNTLI